MRVCHFPVKVHKDFRILTKLESLHIAPAPLFRSSAAEERIVRTAFIAMTWVEVSSTVSLVWRCHHVY